jgi:hypothetical protein
MFRKVEITLHYGSYHPTITDGEMPRFSIELNILNKTRFFTYIAVENIYIKIPISRMTQDDIFDIKCKNVIVTWHIIQRSRGLAIVLVDNLHLTSINKVGNRIRNQNEPICIPLDKIVWTSSPAPEALKLVNNYDFGIINILREPIISDEKKAKKRKIIPFQGNEDSDGYMIPGQSTTPV